MEKRQFVLDVNIPSKEDFGDKYPQYRNYAENEGRAVFDLLMTPEALVYCAVATKMGVPALTGIAEKAIQEIHHHGRSHTPFDKQFIGAVVCALMEVNGFHKTGIKKAVPHKSFTKSELYEQNQ
jgi:hypothetical protein